MNFHQLLSAKLQGGADLATKCSPAKGRWQRRGFGERGKLLGLDARIHASKIFQALMTHDVCCVCFFRMNKTENEKQKTKR